ncbi:hypothetical protein ABEB36_015679 [Hypothenemus hampei]|uniref:RNase H type-1 domain-containing protein n=1 Tax=Hypothenemus hampei TaxID=57062 RepID=A0ABD1DZ83_HYPHA
MASERVREAVPPWRGSVWCNEEECGEWKEQYWVDGSKSGMEMSVGIVCVAREGEWTKGVRVIGEGGNVQLEMSAIWAALSSIKLKSVAGDYAVYSDSRVASGWNGEECEREGVNNDGDEISVLRMWGNRKWKERMKIDVLQKWQSEWDQSDKGREFYKVCKRVGCERIPLSFKGVQFCTGHGNVRGYLKRFGLAGETTGECECGLECGKYGTCEGCMCESRTDKCQRENGSRGSDME